METKKLFLHHIEVIRMLAKFVGMFTDKEVAGLHGVFKRTEYIEIQCGCTIPRYGDTPGNLRVYVNGKLEIDCNCAQNCSKGSLSSFKSICLFCFHRLTLIIQIVLIPESWRSYFTSTNFFSTPLISFVHN